MSVAKDDAVTGAAADESRAARAYLLRVAEPPAPALERFVAEYGPLAAAERVRAARVPEAVESETSARRHLDLVERDVAAAHGIGARLVTPEDEEWPAWPLLSLSVACGRGSAALAAPLGLWVRGARRLDEAAQRACAIVGARAATSYGEQAAADFGYELAARDMGVFSGAAYGIDGAAHRGALAAGGPTVAVLGCGLDVGYPAGHVGLLGRIAEHGVVISEYPPSTPPARHRFLVRNRLIAALTGGTVVVEAGLRSGARNTAATAGTLGKSVMAVPGPVGSAMSVGCHRLIRDTEATLVSSSAEILETAGPITAEPVSEGAVSSRSTDGLDSEAMRIHGALRTRVPTPVETVASAAGVPIERVRAVLPGMEIDGFVERRADGWCKRQ